MVEVVELAWLLPEAAEPPWLPVEMAHWLPAEAASPPRRLHHRDGTATDPPLAEAAEPPRRLAETAEPPRPPAEMAEPP